MTTEEARALLDGIIRTAGQDISFGVYQQTWRWSTEYDGTNNLESILAMRRRYITDLRYATEVAHARLLPYWDRAQGSETPELDALCYYNKPALPPSLNPARARYAQALEEADRFLASLEVPMPTPAYEVGSGILEMMRADGTEPAMPSTFLPLGRSPALVEEGQGLNGTIYRWHLPSGKSWRFPADPQAA